MTGRRLTKFLQWLPLFALVFTWGCTHDNYESGDGDYSYLTSAFSMLRINSAGSAVSFVTDDNTEYTLEQAQKITGARADTTYRVLAYYNETSTRRTVLRGIKTVYVIRPEVESALYGAEYDPVVLNSVWTSANGAYLNLGLSLMEGVADNDDDTSQKLGMTLSEDNQASSAKYKSYTLTLLHDQNGVPEYYKSAAYVSIPLDNFSQNDTLNVVVNTYDGVSRKTVVVP
jgi:hypothetical protein